MMENKTLFDLEDDEDQVIECPSCGHKGDLDDFDTLGMDVEFEPDGFVFCNVLHCGEVFRIHERGKR